MTQTVIQLSLACGHIIYPDSTEFATTIRDLIGTDLGAVGDMSHDAMIKYNKTHPYNPDVKYFTWAGEIGLPSPIFASVYYLYCIVPCLNIHI